MLILISLLSDLTGAYFAVPTVHGVGGLLNGQCRFHWPPTTDLIVLRAPEFLDLVLNFLWCLAEGCRFDRGPDESRPCYRLLVRAAHELHQVENDVDLIL